MAEFDFERFGDALSARLDHLGYSLSKAVETWPETDRAMLSRAINGKTLSAGSVLTICRFAGLDPFDFLKEKRRRVTLAGIRKTLENPPVTAGVPRETRKAA